MYYEELCQANATVMTGAHGSLADRMVYHLYDVLITLFEALRSHKGRLSKQEDSHFNLMCLLLCFSMK